MKYFFLFIFISYYALVSAQQTNSYTQAFSFTNDNDFYLFQHRDNYYTNGFFFNYSKATERKNKKIIYHYTLAQKMYTVSNRQKTYNGEQPFDRPYCGYLFAKFTKDKFIDTTSLLSLNIELGATGNLSLARQLQNWYHQILNVFNQPFWVKQIPNEIGINAGIKYAKGFYFNTTSKNKFALIPMIAANAGTLFINATTGAYLCFGKIENIAHTNLFNAGINKTIVQKKYQQEFYFYIYPQIIYQAYNTTVQGNLFKKPTNPIIFVTDIVPFMYQQTMGIAYAKNKWTGKVNYIFQTKEAVSQLYNHQYVGIQLAYKF